MGDAPNWELEFHAEVRDDLKELKRTAQRIEGLMSRFEQWREDHQKADDDHEKRIRWLEGLTSKALGAIVVVSAVVGLAFNYLFSLIKQN